MIPRLTTLALLSIIALILSSCTGSPQKFEVGAVRDSVYRNDYFKITMPLPAGYHAAPYRLHPAITDTVPGYHSDAPAEGSTATASRLTKLTTLTTQAPGSDSFAPSLTILAQMSGQQTNGFQDMEYGKLLRRYQLRRQPGLYTDESERQEIGRQTFYTFHTIQADSTHQDYYTTLAKGFHITFIFTYRTAEQRAAQEGIRSRLLFSLRSEG